MATTMVEMINICKSFPGVLANDNVNLVVRKGEIHALLGENGAGKSTLMSILTGLYQPDSGEIYINGARVELKSPRKAVEQGIGMVHQHFRLVKPFTVAENIILGLKNIREVYNRKTIEQQIGSFCNEYGMSIEPQAKVWQLSVGEQQKVEIIKSLFHGAEVLILDEPTAVLTPQESERLYQALRIMADKGKTIIVISHKLGEVLAHTDTITVLRGGRTVGTVFSRDTTEQQLAEMMVGRPIILSKEKYSVAAGAKVLELKNVSVRGSRGELVLKELSLTVCKWEIVGIAGVAGNGQRELAEVIAGMLLPESGEKWISEIDYTYAGPKKMIQAGVGYIPEDRLGTGLVPGLNAVENVLLKSYRRFAGWLIDWRQAKAETDGLIREFDVKIADTANPVKLLSGGNLQKLLIAREFAANPELVVAMYPMRGLDVAAMEAVRKLLLTLRDTGKAVLLISEEMDELFALSDRIAVLHEGRVMGIVRPEKTTLEEVGLMMAGKELAV
ncbi:MAG TPA: ABC transporter ATP-binding protein [Negativicutes bacterium]